MSAPNNPQPGEIWHSLPLVRSSERGSFKNCPRQWYWSYVEQIVPVSTELGAREFGTGIHLAMAEHYIPGKKRGRPLLETWSEWLSETKNALTATENGRKKWNEGGKETFDEMAEMGRFLLSEYEKTYGEEFEDAVQEDDHLIRSHRYDCDPTWEVICREETFAAVIHGKAINVGTIDLVIRNAEGEIWIVDHKTGKGFPNESWYRLDDQGGSYGAIATAVLRKKGMIGPEERVKGIIFNFIRKANPDARPRNPEGLYTNKPKKEHYVDALVFSRTPRTDTRSQIEKWSLLKLQEICAEEGLVVYGEVSKVQPAPYFDRYEIERTRKQQNHQLRRVVQDVTVMKMVRDGELPILKAPGKLCSYCDFFQLCELDESGGDIEHMKKALFKHRDPYHDHREGASNSKITVKADSNLKNGKKT